MNNLNTTLLVDIQQIMGKTPCFLWEGMWYLKNSSSISNPVYFTLLMKIQCFKQNVLKERAQQDNALHQCLWIAKSWFVTEVENHVKKERVVYF